MQRSSEVRFGRFAANTQGARAVGDVWRILRDLLGGFVILAVWLALWSWVLLGVMGPLSTIRPAADGSRASAVERA